MAKNVGKAAGAKQQQKVRTDTSVNQSQSTMVVKNTLKATVSIICNARLLFPANCFIEKDYCGEKIIIEQVSTMQDWIERGVCQAMDLQYLRKLEFIIAKPGEEAADGTKISPDCVQERYSWGFSYSSGEVHLDGVGDYTRATMKQHIRQFIRLTIMFANTLEALPTERLITMKMFYYEDITPPGYQPDFFQDAPASMLSTFGDEVVATNVVTVRIAHVETPYHTLKLRFEGIDSSSKHDDPLEADVSSNMEALSMGGGRVTSRSKGGERHPRPPVGRPSSALRTSSSASRSSDAPPESPRTAKDREYYQVRNFVLSTGDAHVKSVCSEADIDADAAARHLAALCREGLLQKSGGRGGGLVLTSRGKKDSAKVQRANGVVMSRVDEGEQLNDRAELGAGGHFYTPPVPRRRNSTAQECPGAPQGRNAPLQAPPATLSSKRVVDETESNGGYEVSMSQGTVAAADAKCSVVTQPLRQGKRMRHC
ncbi:HORMA domain-containing protein [Tribonema minus]|uniref:HORMA domain-containing protein n=1 Tax=Tribonema minus TaxID=303371 RepID=A0A835YQL7_9STRA|nr:HORMA domain-containing protein [Tribonema minus]